MRKFSENNKELLYESIFSKIETKLKNDNKVVIKDILDMVEKSIVNNESLKDASDFIAKYIKDNTSVNVIGFVNDADIFNFYLKHQIDIDNICNDNKYYDKTPSSENVSSLYDYMIKGTKTAVSSVMQNLVKDVL